MAATAASTSRAAERVGQHRHGNVRANVDFVPHGPIKRAFARRLAQLRRVEAGEQRLDQRAAAGVGLAVGEARHRRTQPRHGAERAGRAGIGDGSVEQHATDGKPATFRRRPKCRAPTIDAMTDLADVAAALADRTRARMLEELLGGPPLPAGALAVRVGVAPSTVSAHLRKLERAGLITITSNGRRREARLAGPHVAEALEALANIAGDPTRPVGLKAVNRRHALREARSCYDHLAGRAGVALADQLLDARRARASTTARSPCPRTPPATTASASASTPRRLHTRRPLVRACSDWTERRPHVAGALGKALLDALLDRRQPQTPPRRPRAQHHATASCP